MAANLAPLAGALVGGWDLSLVLLLYWAESGIVGLSNAAKMAVAGRWKATFLVPFFVFHFGFFMFGHLLFILLVFVAGVPEGGTVPRLDAAALARSLAAPTALLALGHGYSFAVNFVARGEFRCTTVEALMLAPYLRVLLMHVVLVVGGFLSLAMGQSSAALALLILGKVAADVGAHERERRRVEAARGA